MRSIEHFESEDEAINYLIREKKAKSRGEARHYLQSHVPKEAHYQGKILKHIKAKYPDAFVFKAAAGPYSRGGVPDIIALIEGKFFAFEVKRPYFGKASKLQEETMKEILRSGGYAGVVSFPEEVDAIIERGQGWTG